MRSFLLLPLLALALATRVNAEIPEFSRPTLAPEHYAAQLQKAVALFNKGELKKAAHLLQGMRPKKNYSLAPEQVYLLDGMSHFHQDEFGPAQKAFERLLRYKQSNSDAIAYLALTLYATGQHDLALQRVDEALWYNKATLLPREKLLLMKGLIYIDKKQPEFAEKSLREAIAANPDYNPARIHLSDVLFGRGKKGESVTLLRQVVKAEPENDTARLKLADRLLAGVNRLLGKKAINEAREITDSLLSGVPAKERSSHPAFSVHIRALINGGELERAEKELNTALKRNPTSPTLNRLRRQMEVERGARDYEELLEDEEDEDGESGGKKKGHHKRAGAARPPE